ncbi:hypothetical protein BV25DRAFT_1315076 [Artomyces pyxidatus]|uniref:Uncharacterized protein n=1 Tax=Artomyces pyxidatus TaxID=48021 RepID=A0ACB8SQS6_9AGAM|nr:hypothetical protein BV25DRAFT_1315076 [Artomyces pyxidatus]
MAQVATMGPPLSPRETRRSGRRTAPSLSASTSKSPDSPTSESAPRSTQTNNRTSVPTSNTSSRNKRSKQEDVDDPVDEPLKNGTNGILTNGNGRAKRKGKEKEKPILGLAIDALTKLDTSDAVVDAIEPEEEQGVTRCVCGSTGEDDTDAGEFMVQCETCNVWQHGLCMGYESEDQLPKDDYHCELCKPELHEELLKKLFRRPRHSSANSHQNSSATRTSRSHSPSHLLKPAKRRNTMNSRDAAYDEKLQEIIAATAAEAAAANLPPASANGSANGQVEKDEQAEGGANGRKKRKRGGDDAASAKRTRSASTTSERPIPPHAREETPATVVKTTSMPAPAPKSSNSRNRRGGGRKSTVQAQDLASVDGDEAGGATSNRRANNSRTKSSSTPLKRGQAAANATNDHPSRRNHAGGANGSSSHAPASSSSRAYHSSHAYVVSQQQLLTSWHLPDYLAHLEPMLPTDTPRPLQVRGSGLATPGRESMERTMERGVKVKWPSKRMSVGDMNKRVRALVEWVGREQANALEHGRRREALEASLKETVDSMGMLAGETSVTAAPAEDSSMIVDGGGVLSESPKQENGLNGLVIPSGPDGEAVERPRKPTMKMMEELMEELIGFQERFGPGAKSKERAERRAAATAS